ncbi:HAD family hydrolase [uncultured Anaerococcus sp.]|uniref:HAD family hydrolase n=1 Tax=uncultured Anaerococcus sp. TaxID=293428 RepID=UPI00280A925B|nr:HAD family hydrolase [uncultured Anaerococcus sp.]MDU5148786.1 HAD family hydrolase [Anaerococcus prevotii]
MIRILAIDIDGTLLNSKSILEKKTIDSLRELEEIGVRIVLNSGRVFSSVMYYANQISKNPVIIANNGAILGTDYENIIKSYPLEDEVVDRLYSLSKENKLDFHFYDLNTYYSDTFNERKLKHLLKNPNVDGDYSVNLSITDNSLEVLRNKNHRAYKFQINGIKEDYEIVKTIKNEFNDKLYFTSSINGVVEMMTKNVSKLETLKEFAKITGLKTSNIAAIGDGQNDYEMLSGAEISFAMGNAKDELKEIANHVVSDNDSGGIIEACEIIREYNRCLI